MNGKLQGITQGAISGGKIGGPVGAIIGGVLGGIRTPAGNFSQQMMSNQSNTNNPLSLNQSDINTINNMNLGR